VVGRDVFPDDDEGKGDVFPRSVEGIMTGDFFPEGVARGDFSP
jgi:hypothetical protein